MNFNNDPVGNNNNNEEQEDNIKKEMNNYFENYDYDDYDDYDDDYDEYENESGGADDNIEDMSNNYRCNNNFQL
jgi:hypothetical protein